MSVALSTITTQLVAALAQAHATFDLSAEGKVRRGTYSEPPSSFDAFAALSSPTISSEPGQTIRRFERTGTFEIHAWAAVPAHDTQARAEHGELLADELMTALEVARFDPANAGGLYEARSFSVSSTVLDADFDPVPTGYAMCVLSIECVWPNDRGLSA